jgi:DNA polymerase-3 subunit beta
MANAKTRLVVFNFQEGVLLLSARNQDLGGDSEESMPVDYSGDPVELGVNGSYLLEELRLCQSNKVRMKFNTALGAIVVEPVTENAHCFFIVMPLRIIRDPS